MQVRNNDTPLHTQCDDLLKKKKKEREKSVGEDVEERNAGTPWVGM